MSKDLIVSEKELKVKQSKANAATSFAAALVVNSNEAYAEAMERGKEIKVFLTTTKEYRESITKPIKESIKKIEAMFTPFEKAADGALNIIRDKMNLYNIAKAKKIEEDAARIAAREGEGKGKLKQETVTKKIEELGEVKNSTKSETATAKTVTTTDYIVEDKALIPIEYMTVNIVAIKQAYKDGKVVPGIKVDTKSRVDIA